MKYFWVFIVAAVMAPTLGIASSFDLLYLPTTGTGRVVRFDPSNRIALGSFGDFAGSGTRYVSIGSNDRAYVCSFSGTTVYNAATGVVLDGSDFPYDKISVAPGGERVYEGFATQLIRYNADLTGRISSNASISINSVMGVSSTVGIGFGVGGDSRLKGDIFVNGVLIGQVSSSQSNAQAIQIGHSQALVTGNTARWAVCWMSGGQRRLTLGSTNILTGATTLGIDFAIFDSFKSTAAVMAVPAHGGYWLVGDDASAPSLTRISYYSRQGSFLFSYTTNAVDVPEVGWGGHIVLAPEPGTMAALAVGIAAMARRGKKEDSAT